MTAHVSRSAWSAVVLPLLIFCTALCAPVVSWARDSAPEFTLNVGGSRLTLDEDDALDGKWGICIEPSFSLAPLERERRFRAGFGVGLGYFAEDVDVELFGETTISEELFLITPEALLSWRQPLGDATKLYVEPGVGVGAVIGVIDVFGSEWGGGYSVRPFVRLGYQWEKVSAGVEAAYRFGHLDFDSSGGDVQNLSVTAFVSFAL